MTIQKQLRRFTSKKGTRGRRRGRIVAAYWLAVVAAVAGVLAIMDKPVYGAPDLQVTEDCGFYQLCVSECPLTDAVFEECFLHLPYGCVINSATCGRRFLDIVGCAVGEPGDKKGVLWPLRVRCSYEWVT